MRTLQISWEFQSCWFSTWLCRSIGLKVRYASNNTDATNPQGWSLTTRMYFMVSAEILENRSYKAIEPLFQLFRAYSWYTSWYLYKFI